VGEFFELETAGSNDEGVKDVRRRFRVRVSRAVGQEPFYTGIKYS
jgi:hypothetical protein